MNEEQKNKKLELAVNQAKLLNASFDSVIIFCTKFDPSDGKTHTFTAGEGNWMARYGSVKEWILQEEGKSSRCE